MRKLLCGNCFRRPVKAKGRCGACLQYLAREGVDAPPSVVDQRPIEPRPRRQRREPAYA